MKQPLIRVKGDARILDAALLSPANPGPSKTLCEHCEVEAMLKEEAARLMVPWPLHAPLRGTLFVSRFLKGLHDPAIAKIEAQWETFVREVDLSVEVAIASPYMMFSRYGQSGIGLPHNATLEVFCFAFRVPIPDKDEVFERISKQENAPFDEEALLYPHRILSAKTYTPGRDGNSYRLREVLPSHPHHHQS